jgi:hypothetical protein
MALGLAYPVGDNYTLMFTSLQVRGHAMFSDEGRTLDEETLEYAWQVEIQLGKLGGKVTAPQVKLLNGCEPVPVPVWPWLTSVTLLHVLHNRPGQPIACRQHIACNTVTL